DNPVKIFRLEIDYDASSEEELTKEEWSMEGDSDSDGLSEMEVETSKNYNNMWLDEEEYNHRNSWSDRRESEEENNQGLSPLNKVYMVDNFNPIKEEERLPTPKEVTEDTEEEDVANNESSDKVQKGLMEYEQQKGKEVLLNYTSMIPNDYKIEIEEIKPDPVNQIKQEEKLIDEFIQCSEDEEMKTPESDNINQVDKGIGIEKDKLVANINGPEYIPVILFNKMTSRRQQKLVFCRQALHYGTEFFLYDHLTFNDHFAIQELNLREAIYWADFYGYPLIANDSADLLS
ncbi:15217_t:CDS:2, partial [Dentiscutata erythropus]